MVYGQPALLKCKARGYPAPRFTWYREDGRLLPDGNEKFDEEEGKKGFRIANARKEDRGKKIDAKMLVIV